MSDECPCPVCGQDVEIGAWPYCPHGSPSFKVVSDSIPGGLTIENLGHTPVTVYSHSERKDIMRARGLREQVRHVGEPGSDKSPHTTRWS